MAPEGNDPEPVEPARSDCACRIREFHTTGLSEGPRQGRDRLGGGPRGEGMHDARGGRNVSFREQPELHAAV